MKNKFHIEDVYGEVAKLLRNSNRVTKSFSDLNRFPLIEGKQALYVLDWDKGCLTYVRGLGDMLGYDETDSEINRCIHAFHPEDEVFVNRIIRGITLHCAKTNVAGNNEYLNLTYRLRKKNGDYIKVLRQSSAYEVDDKGRMISNWSMLTDISFISNSNRVEWDIFANGLSVAEFKKSVFAEFANFFTLRELEILRNIKNRKTNAEIADILNISPHTVSTHRKNIFRKTYCSRVDELLSFCHKNGIL